MLANSNSIVDLKSDTQNINNLRGQRGNTYDLQESNADNAKDINKTCKAQVSLKEYVRMKGCVKQVKTSSTLDSCFNLYLLFSCFFRERQQKGQRRVPGHYAVCLKQAMSCQYIHQFPKNLVQMQNSFRMKCTHVCL